MVRLSVVGHPHGPSKLDDVEDDDDDDDDEDNVESRRDADLIV